DQIGETSDTSTLHGGGTTSSNTSKDFMSSTRGLASLNQYRETLREASSATGSSSRV
ncbi:unnamed protein product, partial [Amoebophrya sp. A25]